MQATIAQVYTFLSARNPKRANEILESAYAEKVSQGTVDEETELIYRQMKISIVKSMGDFEAALEIYKSMDLSKDDRSYFHMIFERSELLLKMDRYEESLALLDDALKEEQLDVVAHGSYLLQIYSLILQDKKLNPGQEYSSFIQRFSDTLGIEGYQPDTSDGTATIGSIEELLWRESDSGYRFADLHQALKPIEDKAERIAIIEKFISEEPLMYYRHAAQAMLTGDEEENSNG